MRFRMGRYSDIEQLVAHGEEFWTHTTYFKKGRPYSPDTVANLCANLMSGAGFIVVLAGENDEVKGFGLVAVSPFVFDTSFKSGLELAYYIAPEVRGHFGIALLTKMEKVAKIRDVEFMSMITMEDSDPEVAAKIYGKLGYEKNETIWTKEL